jgi:Flp pilus assembly pilin Flp
MATAFLKMHKRKAQSTLEYTMVVACIAAALMGMGIYVKRGFQGRFREAADQIGEQYSAKTTKSDMTQTIFNPSNVTVTSTPRWIPLTVNGTTQTYEIIEVNRYEAQNITFTPGSYEETGNLSEEVGLLN